MCNSSPSVCVCFGDLEEGVKESNLPNYPCYNGLNVHHKWGPHTDGQHWTRQTEILRLLLITSCVFFINWQPFPFKRNFYYLRRWRGKGRCQYLMVWSHMHLRFAWDLKVIHKNIIIYGIKCHLYHLKWWKGIESAQIYIYKLKKICVGVLTIPS